EYVRNKLKSTFRSAFKSENDVDVGTPLVSLRLHRHRRRRRRCRGRRHRRERHLAAATTAAAAAAATTAASGGGGASESTPVLTHLRPSPRSCIAAAATARRRGRSSFATSF